MATPLAVLPPGHLRTAHVNAPRPQVHLACFVTILALVHKTSTCISNVAAASLAMDYFHRILVDTRVMDQLHKNISVVRAAGHEQQYATSPYGGAKYPYTGTVFIG